jgi:hypothetical protein
MHCDELELRLGGKPRTVEVRQMHLHMPWAFELVTQPRILDAVEELLGANLLVWATGSERVTWPRWTPTGACTSAVAPRSSSTSWDEVLPPRG